jgi:hypothetical protein
MPDLKLEINDDQLNVALQTAILKAVDDVGREQILKHALNHLTTPKETYRGKATTPLMDIITDAATQVARQIMNERIEKDEEFVKQVEQLYSQAFQRCFGTENREKLLEKMVGAMNEALSSSRY